jgi:peptidoglycan/LPS O-acetylase OafA/YrhL
LAGINTPMPSSSTPSPQPPESRLGNIDLLRGCAVLLVMLFHYTAWHSPEYLGFKAAPAFVFSHQTLGVCLFFIVSGYCIYMTAERSPDARYFWLKRMSRLQPAYIAAIALTFSTVAYFGLPGEGTNWLTAFENIFWLEALPGIKPVDGAYWTLIVEIKFYILFGLAFFHRRNDPILNGLVFCALGAALYAICRFFPSPILFGVLKNVFIFPYAAFFLTGMMIFRTANLKWIEIAAAAPLYVLSCAAIASSFADGAMLLSLAPISAIILNWKTLFVPRPIQYVGLISYPLYLIHSNIGAIAMRESKPFIPLDFEKILFAVAISFLLAAFISHFIEFRFRAPFERAVKTVARRIARLRYLSKEAS